MEALKVLFPASGVETYIFLPPLFTFILSFFCSMVGVSGAFLLLPFNMSVLNFTSPAVTSTNFVYNIVAIPSGVYRFMKEKRMVWPLVWVMTVGTIPGLLIGYFVRVKMLPDPAAFKFFVGCVLLYIGGRMLYSVLKKSSKDKIDDKFKKRVDDGKAKGIPSDAVVKTVSFTLRSSEYEFWGERYSFNNVGLFFFSFFVGIIGGAYGIGGGALIAPFCVTFLKLPIYTIAGATLLATFLSSVLGVAFYSLITLDGGVSTSPDWMLGLLFGIGGFAGIYLGARCQKYVPQKPIKILLGVLIVFVALKYVVGYFM